MALAPREPVLQVEVDGINRMRQLQRHVTEFPAVVSSERHVRSRGERARPSALQRNPAELARLAIGDVVLAAEHVALDQPFTAATRTVEAKADLATPPPVRRGIAVVERLGTAPRELSVHAIGCPRGLAAVAEVRQRRILVAGAEGEQRPPGVARVAGEEGGHAVDTVRVP